MKTWVIVPVLGFLFSCLQVSHSQCNLEGGKPDQDFPDVESEGIESYQMSVEYTVPGATQTDYYTEYYDILNRRGRVDGHQAGKSFQFIYRTSSWEAWTIKGRECTLSNVTAIPEMMKDDQSNWIYAPVNQPEKRTYGPSAMFKAALESWKNKKTGNVKMAYMGPAENKVRGLKAQYWRRCDTDTSYVDYYFSTDDEENAFGMDSLKKIPLRVFFGGTRPGKDAALSEQQYDIISFQPFISLDMKPFQLPKGRGCRRGPLADPPELPDFANKNLLLSAEAIYRVLNFKTGEEVKLWSYYSTLMMALDLTSQHLAYYYTPWNASKSNAEEQEPEVNSPEYVIYDMKHGYAYKTNAETGKCDIIREKSFTPEYKLPQDGFSISLTDPSILYPNNELSYITEGTDRGLEVNIFESVVENFILNKKDGMATVPKAIITHAYLKDNEYVRNTATVKNAPTQVQLRFLGRKDKETMEVLTFNFFGFTTQIRNRRNIFNIGRCFKNDDDYLWLNIGFNADQSLLQKIQQDVPSIQSNILSLIEMQSELNPVRIPVILVDIKDAIYVTMMILGKPPVELDFLPAEDGKTVSGTSEVQGVSTFDECASACLETEDNCWGFSMCGAVCYFGATSTAKVTAQAGCKYYGRYNNETFVPSKEMTAKNIQREVESGMVKLVLIPKDGEAVTIDATSVEVTNPGEDDTLFERMGKDLNPRMRVMKAGSKLKSSAGDQVKNFGKLRYDECQRLCLDFKDCETISYCLKTSECVVSKKYGDDIKPDEIETDNMCNLLTRKYADHFDRSPGNVLTITAAEVLDKQNVEDCARACLTSTKFKCLSFDHCPADAKSGCKLHTVHYPNAKTRESVKTQSKNCGHYFRKFSTEFKKTSEKRYVGSKVPTLTNLTLEECSKNCMEYEKGTCFGFDFCQDVTMFATSCTLLDSDPSQLKTSYSPICTNYLRTEARFAPRPYSNGYAAGIGFLCFLIGGLVGIAIVFVIAYIRVNRR